MPRRTGSALLAAALLAAPALAAAAGGVRVDLGADRTAVALGETLEVTIRVEAEVGPEALALEPGDAFEVVGTQQSREATFSLGGGAGVRLRQVLVTRLALSPRREGPVRLTAVATVKGARHASEPLDVRVLRAGATPPPPTVLPPAPRPAPGAPAFRGWERDLALEVQLDRREAWLGEQVTASVWLLAPVDVAGYERFVPPRWDGFWTEVLETPRTLRYEVRKIAGVPTRAYLVHRVALFPTRAGALTIGAAELNVTVRLGGGFLDPFADVQRVRRRSAPVTVKVKPLPAGAPPGFRSGNVGALSLALAAEPPRATAGQAVAVRVTASGEGNFRAFAPPPLPAVDGARAFDPVTSDRPATTGTRLAGARTLETVLLPARAGELVVPALEWPWFDPRSGAYRVARTEPLRIPVDPAAAGAIPPPAADPLAALRPIRTETGLAPAGAAPPWRSPLLALALALPPLALAALAVRDGLRGRTPSAARRIRGAHRDAARRLAGARRRLGAGEPGAALADAERALSSFAAQRLGAPVAGLTRPALLDALAAAGAPPPALRTLAAALEAVDAGRYGAAGGAADALELAGRALALLAEADWDGEAHRP